jgi:L-ascorbate metabolism protein UlaG (beta-lactamase superfamily)
VDGPQGTRSLIRPALADDAFLADVREAAADPSGFRLWWLGQSGFLVQWEGRHLLMDPYLSDSLTRKYAGTDRPHVRMTARVVDPARLGFVDVITASHHHTDHLDGATLAAVLKASPDASLVIPESCRDIAASRIPADPAWLLGIDEGATITTKGFAISAVAAAHEELERDEAECCRYLGYAVRFGPWTLYHSGDTVRYPGMADALRAFRPDVALLPINGRAPGRRVAGNLDGPEAARLARDLGARLAIPCHYEMFEFNTASPDAFAEEAARIGQAYRLLRAGERFSSAEIGA